MQTFNPYTILWTDKPGVIYLSTHYRQNIPNNHQGNPLGYLTLMNSPPQRSQWDEMIHLHLQKCSHKSKCTHYVYVYIVVRFIWFNIIICQYACTTNTSSQLSYNSSPPSAANIRQWIGSALVQIMACCLFGTKPLSKPMLGYCQSDL